MGASDPRARILDLLHWIEDGFLALLLGILVVLAPLQIILRNAFDAGLSWADAFLRVLVLWIALFGALAASRGNKQIAIDVVSKLLSPRPRALLEFVTGLFTAFVCFVVARYAWAFVMAEREFGAKAFGDVPAWICESAIPFAFAMIGMRHLGHALARAGIAIGLHAPVGREALEDAGEEE